MDHRSPARVRALVLFVIFEFVVALLLIGVVVFLVFRPRAPAAGPGQSVAAVLLPPLLPKRPVTTSPAQPFLPRHWMPSIGEECESYKGRRVCHGPRKVPRPHGEAEKLALKLGLGTSEAANLLLWFQEPPVEWSLAVSGQHRDRLRWPVDGGRFRRGFGKRSRGSSSQNHDGVDIGAPAGTHILATADGLVVYSDNGLHGYGNAIVILHVDASVALYGHCRATYVFAGQQVRAGQIIGEVGNTGISLGNHLHFELRKNCEPLDPMLHFHEIPSGTLKRRPQPL